MAGNTQITFSRLAAFSGTAIVVGFLGIPLSVYLPAYYSGYLGVDLGVVGIAFSAVQLIAIAFDPAVGFGLDATETRWGRFRPWLFCGGPVLALAIAAIFMAKPGVGAIYLIGWQLLLYFGLSMSNMSNGAWGVVLVPDYHERSRLYAWVQVFGIGGALFCLFLPAILGALGHGGEVSVIHSIGWIAIVLAPLTALLSTGVVPEPASPPRNRISLREYLALVRHPAVHRLVVSNLMLAIGPSLTGALYFFYFQQSRGYSFDQATTLLILYIAAGLLIPLWARMSRRLGKHRALMAAAFGAAIVQCTLVILPMRVFWPMAIGMVIAGFTANAFTLLFSAMIGDVSDEIRLQTHQDRTAPLFALISVASKIGTAIPLAIVFPVLKAVGFNPAPGAMNTPAAIHGLENCFIFAPALAMALGALSLWGYHLSAARHGEIRKALDERDAFVLAAAGIASEPILNPAARVATPVELDAAS
ncbi:MAG TPA: MFS transporter [Rhizomicrobium sp.]